MRQLNLTGITHLEQILHSYEGLAALEQKLEQQVDDYARRKAAMSEPKDIHSLENMEVEAKMLLTQVPGWRWALCKREMEVRWAPGKSQVEW